jgi:hypothetical protein
MLNKSGFADTKDGACTNYTRTTLYVHAHTYGFHSKFHGLRNRVGNCSPGMQGENVNPTIWSDTGNAGFMSQPFIVGFFCPVYLVWPMKF